MRSVSALVRRLGHEIDFYVVTRDRDESDNTPYPGLPADGWKPVGGASVR